MSIKILVPSSAETEPEIAGYFFNVLSKYTPSTAEHSYRVKKIAVELTARLSLSLQITQDIAIAALLHDIGKIMIPKSILNKPGKLTKDEFEIIKQHSTYGYQMLAVTKQLHHIAPAVLYHHEKFDGTGYPEGRMGKNIPLISRILTIADVYEAITSNRSYRPSMPEKTALKIIYEEQGRQFDPRLVRAFLINKNIKKS